MGVAMDAGPDRLMTDLDPGGRGLRTSVYRPVSHVRSGLLCISDRLQPTSVGGFHSTGKGGVRCMIVVRAARHDEASRCDAMDIPAAGQSPHLRGGRYDK
jgi:hypothetical protein